MGKFRFNLGPTETGVYHELKCQGISSVTSRFERYDLSEINAEYRSNKIHPYKGEPLPEYAAGDEVKLLIGIKNNHLNPTLITILPSGVGVYKSPFVDIFGSRLIYAGPHSSFSRANSNLSKDLSHAIFHMRETTLNYQRWIEDLHPSIHIDKRFNISISPTPIPESTLIEMEGEIEEGGGDFMHEPIDNLKPIMRGAEANVCAVHKVSIPIARMRELVGEDDSDNPVSYRCDSCAKCITCMKSPRLASISLDYHSKKVIATLPFIKDPVEVLSKKHGSDSNYRQAKRTYLSQCKKPSVERTGIKTINPMTNIQWETLFARLSSDLNDLPIARGDTSTVSNLGLGILTPNRLLLGHNNARSLQGQGFDINSSKIPTSILERNRNVYKTWFQLFVDNIHMFTLRLDKWNANIRICKYITLIFIIFRGKRYQREAEQNPLVAFNSQELMMKAARKMLICRPRSSSDEMLILVQRDNVNPWRASGDLEKSNLMKSYMGHRPVMGRGSDRNVMSTYLKNINQAGIQIPRGTKFEEFLPARDPLLEFLAVSMDKRECWQFPLKSEINEYQRIRGLSLDMLLEVEVTEIIIGETSPDQCKQIFSWFWERHEQYQKLFPTSVCLMYNDEIKISLVDVYRMAGKIQTVFLRRISDDLQDHNLERIPEDIWMQLPVRVMIGNGISYALMITIALERDARNEYLLNRISILDEIISFVQSMPVCVELGVRIDVADLVFYYSLFSGDGKWSWRWEEIPDSLKVYCLGDLRFGFMTYNVFAVALIRDLFPDPDIILKFLGIVDQFKPVKWILELIMFSLDGVEVHNVDFDAVRSRYEMIQSLRFRYSCDSPLIEKSPARVLIWGEIIGDWPVITSGGCRFLSQARERFITQVSEQDLLVLRAKFTA